MTEAKATRIGSSRADMQPFRELIAGLCQTHVGMIATQGYGSAAIKIFKINEEKIEDRDQLVTASFVDGFLQDMPCLNIISGEARDDSLGSKVSDRVGRIVRVGRHERAPATSTRCHLEPLHVNVAVRGVYTRATDTRLLLNHDEDDSEQESLIRRTMTEHVVIDGAEEQGVTRVRVTCCTNPLSCVSFPTHRMLHLVAIFAY